MDFFSSEPAKKSAHKEPAHSGEDQLEIQQNSQSQSQKKTHSQKQNGSQQVRAVSEAQDKEQSEDGEQENSGEAEDGDQQGHEEEKRHAHVGIIHQRHHAKRGPKAPPVAITCGASSGDAPE